MPLLCVYVYVSLCCASRSKARAFACRFCFHAILTGSKIHGPVLVPFFLRANPLLARRHGPIQPVAETVCKCILSHMHGHSAQFTYIHAHVPPKLLNRSCVHTRAYSHPLTHTLTLMHPHTPCPHARPASPLVPACTAAGTRAPDLLGPGWHAGRSHARHRGRYN